MRSKRMLLTPERWLLTELVGELTDGSRRSTSSDEAAQVAKRTSLTEKQDCSHAMLAEDSINAAGGRRRDHRECGTASMTPSRRKNAADTRKMVEQNPRAAGGTTPLASSRPKRKSRVTNLTSKKAAHDRHVVGEMTAGLGASTRSVETRKANTRKTAEPKRKDSITSDGGPLGSRVDEGRSKLREVV